ncbi:MAG: serine hydrolase domain-containing protein [Phycisphaerae bacterium]
MNSLIVSIAAMLFASSVPNNQAPQIPDDVKQMVQARVKNGYAPSIVIGVIDANGSTVMGEGWTKRNGGNKVDGDTVYEIGSITKAFTGILLADMVTKGEVALDDPISKYLPDDIDTPTKDDKEITLKNLSNHTSGLPRLPDNMVPDDSDNPYASYSPQDLYDFLDGYVMESPIGRNMRTRIWVQAFWVTSCRGWPTRLRTARLAAHRQAVGHDLDHVFGQIGYGIACGTGLQRCSGSQ